MRQSSSPERPKTLPYYGGKNGGNPNGRWVASLLPADTNVSYCEPFAGMLGVLMQRPQARMEMVNDLNGDIINWWRMIRDKPTQMARAIALTPWSRAEVKRAGELLRSGKGTKLQRALALFINVQQSIGHSAHATSSWAFKLKRNSPLTHWTGDEVAAMAERLKSVQIECWDALKVIKRYTSQPDAVLYIDPPYQTADTTPYGKVEIDWSELGREMKAQKGRVAVSGYGDEWDALRWRKNYFPTNASVRPGKHTSRTEVLWTNY